MKSGHEKRTLIRNTSQVNDFVHTSLQACSVHENHEVLTGFIDRFKDQTQRSHNLRALRYLLDCLLTEIPLPDGSTKVQSFLEFQEAFELFVAYQNDGKCADQIKNDRHVKKQFKELLFVIQNTDYVFILPMQTKENGSYYALIIFALSPSLQSFWEEMSLAQPHFWERKW